MLIEFSISNYRSFSDIQTLSMESVSSKTDKEKPENKSKTKISWTAKKQKEIELLKSAIIYGANDAGKTNIIRALIELKKLVSYSFRNPLSEYNQSQNFLLDKTFQNKPSVFDLTFIKGGIKYRYVVSTDFKKIISEELISFQHGSPRTIISRNKDGVDLKIEGKKQHIEDSTKPGSLVLSTAIGLNSESVRVDETLEKVYKFIAEDLLIDSGNTSFDFRTKWMILKENKTQIIEIFKEAIGDGIIDVQLVKDENFHNQRVANFSISNDGTLQIVDENQLPKEVQEENKRKTELDQYKVAPIRKTAQGETIYFDLKQHESKGTQRLFHYLGPIMDVLNKGSIFIIDELDDAIHPNLMQFIINLFHSKKYNKKNAQLILTSHNAALIGKQLDIFRRDQIWFVKKGNNQNSVLYPLTDYYTRKEADFSDYYLAGRYGAIREVEES
ncbi:MAG: AAA family ATPase [Rickettsiales bacterium]|nr:AAA family ATPase [Rickettsiales bacterium]